MSAGFRKQIIAHFCPENLICMLCREESLIVQDGLCAACRDALRTASRPPPPPAVDGMFAGLWYEDTVATAIQRFKYNERLAYAMFFANYLHVPAEWQADLLVPVPLHPLREFARTFNQSQLLAEQVSAKEQIPLVRELLTRIRYTPSQTRLTAEQRRKNLRGAFAADPACRNLNLVLMDDVCTTGSTLTACALALKKAGAAKVYAICATTVLR